MSRTLLSSVALCLGAGLFAPIDALAQGFQGTLRGEVRDASGAVIAGATVRIVRESTGETRNQPTTSAGTFNFAELLIGEYTVTVEAPGFAKSSRKGVDVRANQVSDVLVTLQVGDVQQVVEVAAGAEMVQVSSSQLVGVTFNERSVRDLPIAGLEGGRPTGSPLNLAVFAPNTTTQPGGVLGQGGSIGGNRPRNNNFVVDGLDNNLPSVTGPLATIIQDSVQEFTLLTNQFSAEFGHSTAGQFIMVTKSGANEMRGGGWWRGQNRHFNALDNITRSTTRPGGDKPRYDWNRIGGQLGGRILRDRWFYYGAYEYRNLTLSAVAPGNIRVPTAAGLTTLRNLANTAGSGVSSINVGIISSLVPPATAAAGNPVTVRNEATGQLVPVELGTFSGSAPNFDREHLFMISSDYISGRHRISARYNDGQRRLVTPGVLPVAAFNSNGTNDTNRATLSHVFTVTPSVVNELRAAYSRLVATSPVDLPAGPGNTDVFANYGMNDLNLFIGPLSNFPQGQFNNIYQLSNQTSFIKGRHTFKAGVDLRNIILTASFLPRARGEYTWTSLDLFVRDTFPTVVGIRGAGLGNFSQNRPAAFTFFQDTWKIHPRLTLDLGIRYEVTGVARDSKFQDLNAIASIPDFAADPRFAALPPRHQQALLNHLGPGIVFRRPRPDVNNYAPRAGFAWDIFGDGRTSLRGGFGIAHDLLFGNLATLGLPPQMQAEVRETNACVVSPAPAWCVQVPAGTANINNVATAINFSGVGFIEGGQIPSILPGAARQNPAVARAFTAAFFQDEEFPEAYTWSLSLQRQLGESWMVEGRYVGNHVINLPVQRWANAGVPLSARLPLFLTRDEASRASFQGAPTLASLASEQNLLLLPFGFGGVATWFSSDGQSWYNGASISLTKRFSRGLTFNSNYTWAKTIDIIENELNSSFMNPRRPLDHLNIFNNKGLSGLHRAHKFTLHWLWDIPGYRGGSGMLRQALGGWQYTGSYIAESGQPVTIISRRDLNGDVDTAGDTAFYNAAATANTGTDTDFVCRSTAGAITFGASAAACGGGANVVGYVAQNASARYIRGQNFMVSNLGRNTFLSPGMNVWNMALIKNFGFGETQRLQFRVETFNTFNHPNFIVGQGSAFQLTANSLGLPAYVTPGTAQFLDKTSLSGGLGNAPFQRVIQFGARFDF